MKGVRKCQIKLIISVEAVKVLAADQEVGDVEVKMQACDVLLARKVNE